MPPAEGDRLDQPTSITGKGIRVRADGGAGRPARMSRRGPGERIAYGEENRPVVAPELPAVARRSDQSDQADSRSRPGVEPGAGGASRAKSARRWG